MRRFCLITAWALALSGCWQVADIDVIDLPARDGQSDDDGLDADADDDAPEQAPDDQAETTPDPPPPDLPEDPPIEDVPPDLPPPGMSAEDYCRGMVDAYCSYFGDCCSADDYDLIQATYVSCDETGADDLFYGECVDMYGPMLDAGSLRLDEDAFYRCSDYIREAGVECLGLTAFFKNVDLALEIYCRDVFVGLVDEGGACTDRRECGTMACCVEGRCTSCAGSGVSCYDNGQCPATQRCIEETCREIGQTGEPCDDRDEPADSDCGGLLWCRDGRCERLLGSGATCPDPTYLNYGCSGLCLDGGTCTSFCGSITYPD